MIFFKIILQLRRANSFKTITSTSSKRGALNRTSTPSRTRFYDIREGIRGRETDEGKKKLGFLEDFSKRRSQRSTWRSNFGENGHKSRRLRSVYATVNQLIIARPVGASSSSSSFSSSSALDSPLFPLMVREPRWPTSNTIRYLRRSVSSSLR